MLNRSFHAQTAGIEASPLVSHTKLPKYHPTHLYFAHFHNLQGHLNAVSHNPIDYNLLSTKKQLPNQNA